MNIDLAELSANSVYHLMTQTVVPRPIAWVLSKNFDASLNLAPFSYFNAVCSDPPLMMLSMGKKPDGNQKDTAANLQPGAKCVVHIAHVAQAEQVTATAATLDYGVSEVNANQIALTDQTDWPLPRIEQCKVAYLCSVHSLQHIGNTPQNLVFVEALELFIDDEAVREDKGRVKVDALKLNPLARLGASEYANLGGVFTNNRPK